MSAERAHADLWACSGAIDSLLEASGRSPDGAAASGHFFGLLLHRDADPDGPAPERPLPGIRSLCADPARGRMGQARAPGDLGTTAGDVADSQPAGSVRKRVHDRDNKPAPAV